MNICILTYRLHSNFGFLMQAYALQKVIKQLGHEPYTVNIRVKEVSFLSKIKYLITSILRKRRVSFTHWPTKEEQALIDRNTWNFIERHLQLTPYVDSVNRLQQVIGDKYDFYLVGSDQVWRKEYCPRLQSYFFDFISNSKKRASYAASFGTDIADYTPQEIKKCKELLSKFVAVSVREADGVKICRDVFQVEAMHVLDPTLLLDRTDYLALIDKSDALKLPTPSFILVYILDRTKEKDEFIERLSKEKSQPVYYIKPKDFKVVGKSRIEECVYPSVSMWLSAFEKASFVVTDSFHGTVFSLIFKKQFLVLDNPKRGSCRMKSLLDEFSLEKRLLSVSKDYEMDNSFIDYNRVCDVLLGKKRESITFLRKILNA